MTARAGTTMRQTAASIVPGRAIPRPCQRGATLVTKAMTAVMIIVPPPAKATPLAVAPPLRTGPRGSRGRPINAGAVPQVWTQPGVCAMTSRTPGAHTGLAVQNGPPRPTTPYGARGCPHANAGTGGPGGSGQTSREAQHRPMARNPMGWGKLACARGGSRLSPEGGGGGFGKWTPVIGPMYGPHCQPFFFFSMLCTR